MGAPSEIYIVFIAIVLTKNLQNTTIDIKNFLMVSFIYNKKEKGRPPTGGTSIIKGRNHATD
jgi:hypothetical protein